MGIISLTLEFVAGPDKGRRYCLSEFKPILLGRGEGVDLLLPAVDTSISRCQAYIHLSPQDCLLTMVPGAQRFVTHNTAQVVHQCSLSDGDMLSFGKTADKTQVRVLLVTGDRECIVCGRPVISTALGVHQYSDADIYAHEECVVTNSDARVQFGQYESVEIIGTGGAGTVYRVYHRASRTIWAIKHCTNPHQARRFDREMYELQSLRHPNIIRFVHGDVDDKGVPYFVMEYARYGTLAVLAEHLTDNDKVELMCQVLEGLKYLHGPGKVHRDLKPDNILIQSVGPRAPRCQYQAKLSDFGLVKGSDGIVLTTKGRSFCGSVPFIAPEQIDGLHDVDGSADVYSAGVTLYWLLSKHTPIEVSDGQAEETLRDEIRFGERMSLKHWRPDLNKALIKAVDRSCNTKIPPRFRTAAEFQTALQEVL